MKFVEKEGDKKKKGKEEDPEYVVEFEDYTVYEVEEFGEIKI